MSFTIVLFDNCAERECLKPLTVTRPIGNLRVGILTLDQKWQRIFHVEVSYLTIDSLRSKYPLMSPSGNGAVLIINSAVLPNDTLITELRELNESQKLVSKDGVWIGIKMSSLDSFNELTLDSAESVTSTAIVNRLIYPEDVFLQNEEQIKYDIKLLGAKLTDSSSYMGNQFVGTSVYIEDAVTLQGVTLDSTKGPIFIGSGTHIEPGVVIFGPVAIGPRCRVKSGTVIYGNVSIGEECTVCGEINNTVIWGKTAKGHLGYLGCAVIGEGCNIGAGTNNSNLRNDWKTVCLYDYAASKMRDTGLEKCGVIMGDHVMLGIGSKINTGTVIGVGSQIAITNFIPKFVADFTWLTDQVQDTYVLDSFLAMMKRKSLIKRESIDESEVQVLSRVYEEAIQMKNNNQH